MTSDTKRKFCVIGTPVAHSRSPELFARIFTERGMSDSCEYVINEIRTDGELQAFIDDMRSGAWEGCNVTMPWKNKVVSLVDELSVFSEQTSAVNTIRRRPDGSLYGTSTDGAGMLWAIRQTVGRITGNTDRRGSGIIAGIPLNEQNIVILGAGGTARAILAAFASEGMTGCSIVCRDGANRQRTEQIFDGRFGFIDFYDEEKVSAVIADAGIVINCTPLGMIPQEDRLPVPQGTVFKRGAIVADAVYNPERTLLLELAKNQDCICVPGRMMLEGQAIAAADVLLG